MAAAPSSHKVGVRSHERPPRGTLVLVKDSPLHERLLAVAGDRTFRHLSELTGTNAETVRRYMTGQAPSVDFLTAICTALGVNGDWLLTGRGPMKSADVQPNALRQASAPDLISAMASTVERLIDRVDRLEVFVQTVEVRVRAGPRPHSERASPNNEPGPPATVHVPERARLIAGALAQRPRADDGGAAAARRD